MAENKKAARGGYFVVPALQLGFIFAERGLRPQAHLEYSRFCMKIARRLSDRIV
jgi:hypothetical protein